MIQSFTSELPLQLLVTMTILPWLQAKGHGDRTREWSFGYLSDFILSNMISMMQPKATSQRDTVDSGLIIWMIFECHIRSVPELHENFAARMALFSGGGDAKSKKLLDTASYEYKSIYLLTSEPAALFQWPSTIVSSNKCKRLGPQREGNASDCKRKATRQELPATSRHQPELVPLLQVPNEGLYNTTLYHYIT